MKSIPECSYTFELERHVPRLQTVCSSKQRSRSCWWSMWQSAGGCCPCNNTIM